MLTKMAMYRRAAEAIARFRVSLDDQMSKEWEPELDVIEFSIYAALGNSLNDVIMLDHYIHANPDKLHSILPKLICSVEDAYERLLEDVL